MKKDTKVAAVQYQIPLTQIEGEKIIEKFIAEAASKKVDIVGLPEECLGSWEELREGYDPLEFISAVARKNRIYFFGAAYMLNKQGKVKMTGFLFNKKGEKLIEQDKIVLTPLAIEAGFVGGNSIKILNTEFGKVAMLICKDSFHRYAAWFFDKLMKKGVAIVLIPSSSIKVSERSVNLWTDTIKTMSMLFNVFIVAPGTVGVNGIDKTNAFGHALIVSPQTVVLAEGDDKKEEVLFATLKKEHLDRLRSPEAAKWQPAEVPRVRLK